MTSEEKSVRNSTLQIYRPRARTEEERRAASEAFLKLSELGWKSVGPSGPRDELYDR